MLSPAATLFLYSPLHLKYYIFNTFSAHLPFSFDHIQYFSSGLLKPLCKVSNFQFAKSKNSLSSFWIFINLSYFISLLLKTFLIYYQVWITSSYFSISLSSLSKTFFSVFFFLSYFKYMSDPGLSLWSSSIVHLNTLPG